MKTTSREKSQELVDAGWVRETALRHVFFAGGWSLEYKDSIAYRVPGNTWLPAPTLDEILEDLSFDKLVNYYWSYGKLTIAGVWWYNFSEWLYTIMRSANDLATVWIAVKGNK